MFLIGVFNLVRLQGANGWASACVLRFVVFLMFGETVFDDAVQLQLFDMVGVFKAIPPLGLFAWHPS